MRRLVLPLLILVVLSAVTGLLTATRFATGPENMVPNIDFRDGFDGWSVTRPEGTALVAGATPVLSLDDPGVSGWTQVFRRVVPPEGVRYLWFEGWIRSRGAAPLAGRDRGGRLFLRGVNADGMDLDGWPHLLIDRQGDTGWTHATGVFPVRAAFQSIRLGVSLVHAEGRVEVRDLRLRAARQVAWFPAALGALIACWAAGIWYLVRAAAGPAIAWQRTAAAALLVLLGAVVLVAPGERLQFLEVPPWGLIDMAAFSSGGDEDRARARQDTPGGASGVTGADLGVPAPADGTGTSPVAQPVTTTGEAIELLGRRLGQGTVLLHLAGFAGLTGLACWLVGSWRLVPAVVVLAFLSEGVQYLGARSATAKDAADLGANLLGVLAGYGLWAVVYRHRNRTGTR